MIQKPYGILAMISSGLGKCIKQHAFLCRRCLAILRHHVLKQFPPCLKIQSSLHDRLPWKSLAGDTAPEMTDMPLLASREIFLFDLIVSHPFLLGQEETMMLWPY